MEFRDGSASNEHQELHKSAIEGAHHLSVSSLRISPKSSRSPNSPRSPRSPSSPSVPKSPRSPIIPKSPRSPSVPKSPSSPRVHCKGSPLKNDRHSHSLIDGRPKKGGSGGKGTWGGLLDIDDNYFIDPNDPNYDSSEECEHSDARKSTEEFEEYKKKATIIVEEYFATDDFASTLNELRELGKPGYSYYFVKKLVSIAMDRHDKEKEMAAALLSALYADVINPSQVYKGSKETDEKADEVLK